MVKGKSAESITHLSGYFYVSQADFWWFALWKHPRPSQNDGILWWPGRIKDSLSHPHSPHPRVGRNLKKQHLLFWRSFQPLSFRHLAMSQCIHYMLVLTASLDGERFGIRCISRERIKNKVSELFFLFQSINDFWAALTEIPKHFAWGSTFT